MSALRDYDPECDCEERDCSCAVAPGTTWTLDGKERLVHSPEGYLLAAFRVCLNCEEEFELYAEPDEDTRLYCSEECGRWWQL